MSDVLTQIKKVLGMEVKLEQMKLDNGTIIEAEMFEAGQAVFIVNEQDRVALPVGEYTLEDGRILVVATEGEIAEVKDAMPEQPEAPEVEVEVEQSAEPAPAPTAKKVIESTVKESHFSKEEVDALKSEIENLKTELASLKKVEEVELAAQPLTHSPEVKQVEKILFAQNREKTTFDRVMEKIAN